jgi:hypothetical protein
MGRERWLLLLVLPTVAAILAMLAVPAGVQTAQLVPAASTPTPQVSSCQSVLQKWVDPLRVVLGESADVTMVVSGTCPSQPGPIDMVILADESWSMTKSEAGNIEPTEPTIPQTPDPRTPPASPTFDPGDVGGFEPPFCGGSVPPAQSSPTPTRWRWRTPTPAPHPETATPELEFAGSEDRIGLARQWVNEFVKSPEIKADCASDRLHMGFLSFNRRTRLRQTLTADCAKVGSMANRLKGDDVSYIQTGVREAEKMLDGTGSRIGQTRLRVLIIVSDFQFCKADVRRAGLNTVVMTVGMDPRIDDLNKARNMASKRLYASDRGVVRQTIKPYTDDLAVGGGSVYPQQFIVRDELADEMALVPGSLSPPTVTLTGQLIEWQIMTPTLPITLGYRVEPLATGVLTVSRESGVTWTDNLNKVGSAPFPGINIEVIAPTETPTFTPTPTSTPMDTPTSTATPTATYTPTPEAKPLYLPITFKLWPPPPTPTPVPTECKPDEQTVDVALVIDTSDSMTYPIRPGGVAKLDAAVAAASGLVPAMKSQDQLAVVAFNAQAHLLSVLTSDKAQVTAALQALPTTRASGTAIDKGLRAAYEELTGPRHISNHNRAIVLLTDGQQNASELQSVRDVAGQIKAAGIKIITIGLGGDVDAPFLTEIATAPQLYFPAPETSDLDRIYKDIVHYIPCP